MAVQEFRKLPEDSGAVYHELRHGELFSVTRPKLKHYVIQNRLCHLLKTLAPAGSFVGYQAAFRPLPEHELRVADVAFVSRERWAQADPGDNLKAAPETVIEVLSPSNTVAEMYDEEKLCLENGAEQFWIVDPDRRQVKVSTADGRTMTYRSGQEIPLERFGGRLAVDAIFD
jgi:Uma2 family endonuclease